MSFSIDANILLYASDRQSPWHEQAGAFLHRCVLRSELFCLAWPTLMAYLRIATHSGIFSSPLTPDRAQGNVESLLMQPRVRTIGEGGEFWPSFQTVANEVPLRGNLVPDAHLAALLLEHGVSTLYTRDRDFLKFPALRMKDPFQ